MWRNNRFDIMSKMPMWEISIKVWMLTSWNLATNLKMGGKQHSSECQVQAELANKPAGCKVDWTH